MKYISRKKTEKSDNKLREELVPATSMFLTGSGNRHGMIDASLQATCRSDFLSRTYYYCTSTLIHMLDDAGLHGDSRSVGDSPRLCLAVESETARLQVRHSA